MGEAEIEISIGQLKTKHRALVANIEDDLILGMNLITCHGLMLDLGEKVLRFGNEELKTLETRN